MSMADRTVETSMASARPQPLLRVVGDPGHAVTRAGQVPVRSEHEVARGREDPGAGQLAEALRSAEERARAIAARVEQIQAELQLARTELVRAGTGRVAFPHAGVVLRAAVGLVAVGLLGLVLWARAVDYALRVTSDTPTFVALISDMATAPFERQSPFLEHGTGTQHATPYMQLLAFLWSAFGGEADTPVAIGRFLALVGIVVFAFALWCVFLYVRRLAGSTAAWASVPVLLGVFGPPHVIWASDLSLHGALYAGFFPQTLAIATTLLTLVVLERRSNRSLAAACMLSAATMLVHPFTGVLLAVLATAESCRLAVNRDRAAVRAPIALATGFLVGTLWPAYSLDRAFAETGLRGFFFIGLCVLAPAVALRVAPAVASTRPVAAAAWVLARIETAPAALRLAIVGGIATCAIAVWEWMLVQSPPDESARLAIYWVDDRWRWPLLLVAGLVGLSGLARLARHGHVVPAVWFVGCAAVGTLGAMGLPVPVWYRFLLLCQVPLAVGVATVVAQGRREPRTVAIIAATFAVALGVKAVTLLEAPANVSYFGQPLQPAWSLGRDIPPGPGLVATDPATAYFIPATTGRHVLTVDKGHVSSRAELARSAEGYRLLRRFYAGDADWWAAAREMWRRGVRYVVVAKQTTLEPKTLDDFIWQSARLETDAQRKALGNYYYENNRVGTLVLDSPDYAVYRLVRAKLFGPVGGGAP
jgi:hypothetical protein